MPATLAIYEARSRLVDIKGLARLEPALFSSAKAPATYIGAALGAATRYPRRVFKSGLLTADGKSLTSTRQLKIIVAG